MNEKGVNRTTYLFMHLCMFCLPHMTPARLRVLGYFYAHFLLSRLLIC